MFFSILIPDLRVVAHSQWEGNGVNTKCQLWILTDQEAVRELLVQLPEEEATELTKHLSGLPKTAQGPSIDLQGLAAASLSNEIARYYNNVVSYKHLPVGCELLSFQKPPGETTPSEGIIMWSDMDVNYHVAVVYSKEQADRLIRGFDWLPPERQARLLNEIKGWNVQESCSQDEYRIGGIPAKLLCRASVASRAIP